MTSTYKKHPITRRTFLKGSLAAITTALAGSNGNFTQGNIYRPNIVRAQSKNVILAIQEFAHEALKDVLQDFEEETGLTVTLENSTASGVDILNRLTTAFEGKNSPFDVISMPDDGMPTFLQRGWLEPLEGMIPQTTWDDFPEIMAEVINGWSSQEGVRYRVPHEFAVGYCFVRQDWLDEKELVAPTTWEEMVEVGKAFTDTENDTWGTTDGLIRPALLFVYVAYLTAQAGGSVFDFDEATGEALQFLYDLIHTHKIFPEEALNEDYGAQNERYMADQVAFMRQWPFFQDVGQAKTDWYAPEKMKIILPPAGPAGSKSWVGGHGFSVPTYAANKEGAAELIQYLTSNRVITRLAQNQSFFVTPRNSILTALGDKENPIVDAMALYSENNVPTPRPFHLKVADAQTVVDDVASVFISKQATLAEALQQGKERMAELSKETDS